ncbi:MAG: Crp/Fnr family transcriptional regulator [bacterium]|nr:MAG: Crp/Fnr family transcriptional regulator [bacterium]
MDKIEILEKLGFYSLSPPRFKTEIENACTPVTLEEGKVLFVEGEGCQQVGFVGEGSIRVSKIGETGREITLYHVNPGEGCVLNISCAFSDTGYPAMATIEKPTQMVVFSAGQFRDWMSRHEIRGFVFELFSKRLAQVITLIEEIVFRKMDQRLAEFLAKKFDNRGKPKRILRITQEQIATEMGTAREVVNRLLKEFERVGAIASFRGRIQLENESRLKTYSLNN